MGRTRERNRGLKKVFIPGLRRERGRRGRASLTKIGVILSRKGLVRVCRKFPSLSGKEGESQSRRFFTKEKVKKKREDRGRIRHQKSRRSGWKVLQGVGKTHVAGGKQEGAAIGPDLDILRKGVKAGREGGILEGTARSQRTLQERRWGGAKSKLKNSTLNNSGFRGGGGSVKEREILRTFGGERGGVGAANGVNPKAQGA